MTTRRSKNAGKFIVIDGADATGKHTQVEILSEYLRSFGISVTVLDFPRYYDNFWGKMVGVYLRGAFGGLYDNNPYLSTLPYILDQADARLKITKALKKGSYVLANRYTSSNVHQAAKLPLKERDKYLSWLDKAAFRQLHAVKPDVTIILNVNPHISLALNSKKKSRAYLNGDKVDIAEKDFLHQQKAHEEYHRVAQKNSWPLIVCNNPDGSLKTPQEIHKKIIAVLTRRKMLPPKQ